MNLDWLAGFFDGEGGFYVQPSGHVVRVTLTNTNKASLEEAWRLFPLGRFDKKSTEARWKDAWQLRWDGEDALPLLEALRDRCFVNKTRIDLAIRLIVLCRENVRGHFSEYESEKTRLASELVSLGTRRAKKSFEERRIANKSKQRQWDAAKVLGVSSADLQKAIEVLARGEVSKRDA